MGATNAMLAYQLYAGRVPATSMQLLAFMALVSRDQDDKPWFGQGYEALAVFALGRQAPLTDADLRAVERAMKPLRDIGAVVTERRAAARRDSHRTARYRLRLVAVPAESIDTQPVDNPAGNHSGQTTRPTENGGDDPRKTARRPTKTVQTTHENRGAEEQRGTTRSDREEDHLDPERKSPLCTTPTPEAEDSTPTNEPPAAPPAPTGPAACERCGVLLDPDRHCRNRACPPERLAEVIQLRPTG